jgi:enoyl-CoA hydratase
VSIDVERDGPITVVMINRPERRNAVDREHARALADAFRAFDADENAAVSVLTGAGGTFCAGADLKGIAEGQGNRVTEDGDGPMGPTRLLLSKPVIAAVEGYAVAGGLELACWSDLRVAAGDSTFGVFCRRWGVPLVDGGTVHLPRIVGHGVALDLILTGRAVSGEEALRIGLVNRVTERGGALDHAIVLAGELAALPQACMRHDRLSSYEAWGRPIPEALRIECGWGQRTLDAPDAMRDIARFVGGEGRHGAST